MKMIEMYDIERDEWKEVRMQLNYGRAFCSSIPLGSRFIYILGGTTDTECIERFDAQRENENMKCELILLNRHDYIPWFKEIILPLDEEGIICFCGE